MKPIRIDAPAKRSLNVPEKKVYQLLEEGKTPFEIAKILHIPFLYAAAGNSYNVAKPSVQGIVMSIREKGWTLPNEKKEEEPMAEPNKGKTYVRLTDDQKRTIIDLHFREGVKVKALADRFDVDKSTVYGLIRNYKEHGSIEETETSDDIDAYTVDETEKEPATVGAVTSSEEESVVTNISVPIVPDIEENVKPVIPKAVIEAVNRYRDDLKKDIAEHESYIDDLKGQLAELEEFIARRGT